MMEAKIIQGAIVLTSIYKLDGEVVLETTCRDYTHYTTLPDVVEYAGVTCGKCSWNSDRNYACYKSGAMVARCK